MAAIQGVLSSISGLVRPVLTALKPGGTQKARDPKQTAAPKPETQPQLRGDVDGDGTVTIRDAKALLMHLFGNGPQPAGLSNADLNGDGSVNLADALALLNQLASQNTPAVPEAVDTQLPAIQTAPVQLFFSPAHVSRAYRASP